MANLKKHHDEHLDGTKGRWRPALVANVMGPDGHPASWNEIVVITCPSCGAPQGVGADAVKIVNGKTDGPWACYHCGHSEVLEFESHQEPHGREHFAKLKDEAAKGVSEARIRQVHDAIKEQMQQELHEKALVEAKKIFPDGANHADALKNFMKDRKKPN